MDRLLHLVTQRYLDDLCPNCGAPRLYSTRPDTEHHYECLPATRCHSCTAIEREQEKYKDQDAPRSLMFSARPSEGLAQAISSPTVTVAPRLPVGTDGTIRATPAQLAEWAMFHHLL